MSDRIEQLMQRGGRAAVKAELERVSQAFLAEYEAAIPPHLSAPGADPEELRGFTYDYAMAAAITHAADGQMPDEIRCAVARQLLKSALPTDFRDVLERSR